MAAPLFRRVSVPGRIASQPDRDKRRHCSATLAMTNGRIIFVGEQSDSREVLDVD
ncbi:hypothetical protein [Sphingomonas sp. Leaf231]|uniref:hypothetical protein n=1 Tax=Sphingomonas sp. Leaf231 TaxID=1736301 RepID=UPI0012E189F2|nr:hypothetical protein [Sphingomonas sp. Leaf231]